MKEALEKLMKDFPELAGLTKNISKNLKKINELKMLFEEENENNMGDIMDRLMGALEIAEGIDDKKYCEEALKPIIKEMDKKLEEQVVLYRERVKDLQNSLLTSLNERNKIIKNRIENSKTIDLAEERLNKGIKINELLNETLKEMEDNK